MKLILGMVGISFMLYGAAVLIADIGRDDPLEEPRIVRCEDPDIYSTDLWDGWTYPWKVHIACAHDVTLFTFLAKQPESALYAASCLEVHYLYQPRATFMLNDAAELYIC